MNNFVNRSIVTLMFVTLFGIGAYAGIHTTQGVSPAATSSVLVTNTSSQAVPVLAQESGAWSVNVANRPTVMVQNPNSLPVPIKDVNNIAHDPFAIRLNPFIGNPASFAVPARKRLVIDQFTAYDNGGTILDYQIVTTTNGVVTAATIPVSVRNGVNYAIQQLTLVADPGSYVYVEVTDTNPNDTAGVNVSMQGYYVDYY